MLLGARQFFERRGAPTPPLPYDAEVEYLESTGTQWIDTGVHGSDNLIATCRFQSTSADRVNSFPFAARRGPNQFGIGIGNSDGFKFWAGLMRSLAYIGAADTVVHESSIDTTSGAKRAMLDGVEVYTSETTSLYATTNAIVLFAHANSSAGGAPTPGFGRIYSFSVGNTITGVMAVNLTPVRKDGIGYMYDSVTGTLFGNAGTGAFTIGPDKS